MKPVAVLGAGPAGLMAAHAVALKGRPVALIGNKVKSHMSGAQFLHEPIPVVCSEEPDAIITYKVEGSAMGYKQKVYGDDPNVNSVSISHLHDGMTQPAWNLLAAYDKLWDLVADGGNSINDQVVDTDWLDKMVKNEEFDLIISSIPGHALCKQMHNFHGAPIRLMDDSPMDLDDNVVYYDGTKDRSYYRTSNLFGVKGTEWSGIGPALPYNDVKDGVKPIRNNCDCYPDVVRVGRFGKWTKGVLTHHAFIDALEAIDARFS